jgi:Transposase, Mutator family
MTFTGAPISSRAAALTVSRGTSAVQRSDRDGAGVEHVVPFFAFAPSIRKMIYTTNAVEALHRSLRKIIKTRRQLRQMMMPPSSCFTSRSKMLACDGDEEFAWTAVMGRFAIQFGAVFLGHPPTFTEPSYTKDRTFPSAVMRAWSRPPPSSAGRTLRACTT